ncbi:MAG: Fic family protein [gamma proteobacterium symbiont of Taylorina sp.]|nr:Fic family protein [gamma proteobacterium symbiont of Taylorina sp.]
MKIPVIPPNINELFDSITSPDNLADFFENNSPVDDKGRYLHWDKLRHLSTPEGLSSEQWWLKVKIARKNISQPIPLLSKQGSPFNFATIDQVHRELHWLDRYAAGAIKSNEAISNTQTRNTYLVRSLIEEAINSSQLEGASTTRDVAREMIRQSRHPKDKSEQMIFNNYHAMQFINEIKDEPLTPSIIFELHTLLTHNTMDESAVGRFRAENDQIYVVDNMSQEYLHKPPPSNELEERLNNLCFFANQNNDKNQKSFFHPVIKSIALHFMLAYDHPFCDGNGRTARALFYWSMAKEGYWLMEYISISRIIKLAPAQYSKAFLYTETDDNDLTYFILHQLEVIHQAIDELHIYLDKKVKGINEAEHLLINNPRLSGKLNFRQLALLRHALKHPRFSYVIQEHQQSHGISYERARRDLIDMSDKLNLLVKTRRGKRFYFIVPDDLNERISKE